VCSRYTEACEIYIVGDLAHPSWVVSQVSIEAVSARVTAITIPINYTRRNGEQEVEETHDEECYGPDGHGETPGSIDGARETAEAWFRDHSVRLMTEVEAGEAGGVLLVG
jgi:hypothetical protein